MSLLELRGVEVAYGDLPALRSVSVSLEAGETLSVVGANGAGKTTMLRTISGLMRPRAGQILLDGERLDSLPSYGIVARGVVQVPEGRKIFPSLTVLENLELGSYVPAAKARRREGIEQVFGLFPRLKERERQKGGTMSGGEQQMLAIGRALMAQPKLLLLDEPSLGLAPVIVDRIYEVVRELNSQGVTILLVEQNANYALDVSARGYVLETGHVALTDTSENLRNDERVQAAYLGA